MKGLEAHIKEQMDKFILPGHSSKFRTFDEFMDLNNVNDFTITEEQIKHYYYYNWNGFYHNYIDENIYTHPADDFIKKFKERFPNSCKDIYKDPSVRKTYNTTIFIVLDKENDFVDEDSVYSNKLLKNNYTETLQNLLDYYNYYVTLVDAAPQGYIVYLEPLYTKNMMKYCKSHGGKLYHVTKEKYVDSIKRTGIRPRVGKTKVAGGYRYFPAKLFLLMNGDSVDDTLKSVQTTINDNILKEEKYAIIEISISNHCLPIFDDNGTEDRNSVYTFNAIDPKLITNIWHSFEEMKEYFEK